MKRKEKENLKNMSDAELRAQLRDLEKHLFQIKFKRASSPLENPIEIRLIRRKMAMIKTCIGTLERAAAAKTSEVKK
ncbi:MAG: 50S ribosomal protein L29 [Elusimicrobia bacterium RIFOXYA12_FULL_51_18]|nr:MAG: 50S ribosomal protein L29 [Elusimicrobia bacterium RIFOXYA12_FULL_51_18]OGS28437.1 MAG: 50S ribosomal protein L29 [Elusimicrobia bacterium RIFOXYA2_FULL_53_38]